MKFDEKVQQILNETKIPKIEVVVHLRGSEFPYPYMMQSRNPSAKKDKKEVQGELKKYGLTLKGYSMKNDTMKVKGTAEDIKKFILDGPIWVWPTDEKHIGKNYPSLATAEENNKAREIELLIGAVGSKFSKDEKEAVEWWNQFIKDNPDLTSGEIHSIDLSKWKYEITSEESISARWHSSTWATTIKGSIKLPNGKTYKKDVLVDISSRSV